MLVKQEKRQRRHKKVRSRISGTAKKPRLCVSRSARHIYAQLIDDDKNKTLLSASDSECPKKPKIKAAQEVGKLIAKKAIKAEIKKVVFDRGGFKYHGRVKALAEGAREGGLEF